MDIKNFIKDIPDFPVEGIFFRDIQPLLADSEAFFNSIQMLSELTQKPDYYVGIESRGFIFASALASYVGTGLKIIRKAGKLPDIEKTLHRVEYDLEYGSAAIEMESGWGNVVIVDDVLATGGTIKAAEHLATFAGYQVIDSICLVDIGIVKNHTTKCIVTYE